MKRWAAAKACACTELRHCQSRQRASSLSTCRDVCYRKLGVVSSVTDVPWQSCTCLRRIGATSSLSTLHEIGRVSEHSRSSAALYRAPARHIHTLLASSRLPLLTSCNVLLCLAASPVLKHSSANRVARTRTISQSLRCYCALSCTSPSLQVQYHGGKRHGLARRRSVSGRRRALALSVLCSLPICKVCGRAATARHN